MSKSFSLIELIFSIIILSFVFFSFSLYFKDVHKNILTFNAINNINELEILLYENPNSSFITLKILNFNNIKFIQNHKKDKIFEFYSLKPLNKNYNAMFK